jgi:hypothetical protein
MQDTRLRNSIEAATNFQFTIVGRINHDVSGALHINCDDGTQLRVIPTPKDYPDKRVLWHLVPTIDSTAIISNVRVLGSSPLEVEQHDGGECALVGKVLQVSKRNSVVLFSVEQPSGKQLKITLTNPDLRMKTEQIWSVKARIIESKLQIVEADPLSPVEEAENEASPQETAPAPRSVIANPSPPNQKAIDAISLSTGVDGWELMTATPRSHGWEWEAINPHGGRKARVAVAQGQYQVYEYNPNIAPISSPPNTERLVVTPLGAARGIGASCFKVEIGPYEVVLDCGTRPKGYDPLPALEYLDKPNLL